ncbi:hypothetical protein [Cellulosimicrobium sp. CUA-896]|uniref:hypothetical protein n=1 Tax=Cellulosimicrobium sp. CUA-896 TaxID=1517881 RepID=UPI000967B469|nr:hypothetical protein [Cellulosimicrobium sp. CUA-896]OLT50228.1 hypothetical protein BJF88_15615 [Cellulosimicrobium sp. CUA-896]
MKHRSLPATLTAAAAGLAVAAAGALPAAAAPAPDDPPSTSVRDGASLDPVDKVAPSLAAAAGTVTAFVELDAPSGVDLTAQAPARRRSRTTRPTSRRSRTTWSRSRRRRAARGPAARSRCR